MTAAGVAPGGGEHAGVTASIGSVLDALRAEFPEITISKIRFLESEGLISPARTPSGYRQFSAADVARLRFVLSAQRDHYLPLKVIRAKLEEFDRDPSPDGPGLAAPPPSTASRARSLGPVPPTSPAPAATDPDEGAAAPTTAEDSRAGDRGGDPAGATRSLRRDELLAEDGVDEALLDALEQHGVLRPDAAGDYDPAAPLIARTAAALAALGVEPRLLRGLRAGADREVGLLAQLVTPVARSRGPEATRRADELSGELATLSGRLHALLVGAGLRHGLRR